jgi:hypothetical protein
MDPPDRPRTRDDHLFAPGPKRILALDGGGVRGALSIAFLERLETVLAEVNGSPVRLCDWFDIIGGTSTGAVIATALALGHSAADIRRFYEELAPKVFRRPFYRIIGLQAKFDSRLLLRHLATILGDRTLDTADLVTGLGMMIKRIDTGSSWIILNNPRSAFWDTPADGSFIGNRHMPLSNLVRASTAAPSYFDPELIRIIDGQEPGLFIDGGLTPHNNPALMLFLAVAIPAFGLGWPLGPQNLTIVSIGSGTYRTRLLRGQLHHTPAIGLALTSLVSLITDNQELTMLLMSWLGETPHRWRINSEVGDLGAVPPPLGPLFRFLRYDVLLEHKWLAETMGLDMSDADLTRLQIMDDPSAIPDLYRMGQAAAAVQVVPSDWS